MSVFDYSSCIKIDFDKAILTDVSIIMPSAEQRLTDFIPAVSGTYSGSYPVDQAFDGSTSTYWRASSTAAGQWIGFYNAKKTVLSKIRVYFGYSSGRPNAYVVRGSNDNSTWTDVASGNFTNASAWQEITCSGYKFRYWRLVFNSRFSSYYTCSEIEFYELVIPGWQITGEEYTTEPMGEAIDKEYTIDKITKSEDNKSLYVWLDLGNRMKFPRSITVTFNGLLSGPGGAQVEPFTETFTPVGITPIFNPNAPDHLTITSDFALTVKEVVYSSAKLDEPADQIGIFPSSMSITVIHVGTLPL